MHYETTGWMAGLDPSAQFSTSKYLAAYADMRNTGVRSAAASHHVWAERREDRVQRLNARLVRQHPVLDPFTIPRAA